MCSTWAWLAAGSSPRTNQTIYLTRLLGCSVLRGLRALIPLEQGEKHMKRWSVLAVALLFGLSMGLYMGGPFIHGQATQTVASPKELTSFRHVVKNVLPAVVSIESKTKLVKTKNKQPGRQPFDE